MQKNLNVSWIILFWENIVRSIKAIKKMKIWIKLSYSGGLEIF